MTRRLLSLPLLVLSLSLASRDASADIVGYRFDGTINAIDSAPSWDFSAGSTFWFNLSWDTNAADAAAADPTIGAYIGWLDMSGEFNGHAFSMTAPPGSSGRYNFFTEAFTSRQMFFAELDGAAFFTGDMVGGARYRPFALQFSLLYDSIVFPSDSAGSPLATPDRSSGLLWYTDSRGVQRPNVGLSITSVASVPEPSTLLLLGLGFGAGLWQTRRRSRRDS